MREQIDDILRQALRKIQEEYGVQILALLVEWDRPIGVAGHIIDMEIQAKVR